MPSQSEAARRPSVAVSNGTRWVSYERDALDAGAAKDVVAARNRPGDGFDFELVASTARAERLDAVLHAMKGRFWIDWKQSDGAFAYSERLEDGWAPIRTVPWTDHSWVGTAAARKTIQQRGLGAGSP